MYSTLKYFAGLILIGLIAVCIAQPYTSEMLTQFVTSDQKVYNKLNQYRKKHF